MSHSRLAGDRSSRRRLIASCSVLLALLGAAPHVGDIAAFAYGRHQTSQRLRHSQRLAGSDLHEDLQSAGAKASEWRMNIGAAIDVLREDMPGLFHDDDHVLDYSIYSPDVILEDARMPNFQMKGLKSYQNAVNTIKWSVPALAERAKFEIVTVSAPVDGVIRMRWKLHLWTKDPLAKAKDFFSSGYANPTNWGLHDSAPLAREAMIVEGYSAFEVDAWTAEITRHSIEVTNPPMPLADLIKRMQPQTMASVFSGGLGVPTAR